MNLSISSFKSAYRSVYHSVWTRPAIAGCLLLALYQGLIWLGAIPPSSGINQWQENVIHAERYLYSRDPVALVLVGSSLAANLDLTGMGTETVNLGMAGGCSQTGLAVVRERQPYPEAVLVEINQTLDRGLDQEFMTRLTHPVLRPIRQLLSSFRAEYTPVSVFVSLLQGTDPPEILPPEQITNSPLRQQEMARLLSENERDLETQLRDLLHQEAAVIRAQIDQLEAEGLTVILFEPPGEPVLQNTPRQRAIATQLQAEFPQSAYTWLPQPEGEWLTSDGLHLTPQEVQRYRDWLRQQPMVQTMIQ